MNSTIFTNIGLILDIVGVIILFRYGLPSVETKNLHLLVTRHPDEKQKRQNRIAERMAKTGLYSLIAGFIFQIIGTNINHF